MGGVHINVEKCGKRDKKQGVLFPHAKPDDGHRQPADAGNGTQHMQKRVKQPPQHGNTPGEEPCGQTKGGGDAKSARHPPQAGPQVQPQRAGIGRYMKLPGDEIHQHLQQPVRGGQLISGQRARGAGGIPDCKQSDGHHQRQRVKRTSLVQGGHASLDLACSKKDRSNIASMSGIWSIMPNSNICWAKFLMHWM